LLSPGRHLDTREGSSHGFCHNVYVPSGRPCEPR
jgi:hypothetical protein